MGTYHDVAQGEYLPQIARAYGFVDYHPIWDHAQNKALKDQRKNPNVLYPGDRLFIPDRETKEEARPTEKKHRFELRRPELSLRIVLRGLAKETLGGHECLLTVEDATKELTTQSDGLVQTAISAQTEDGKLIDKGGVGPECRIKREIPLQIGFLDPVDTVSGQIARLNNLGYDAGELPDHNLSDKEEQKVKDDLRFRSAVEEFQCDYLGKNNLSVIQQVVDGICGKQTQAKLQEVHGC